MHDVAIIGSSLAGSAAALEAQRAGLSVMIIDKASFPRSKACGEGLTPRGVRELVALGLRSNQLEGALFPIHTIEIRGAKNPCIVTDRSNPFLFGVRRHVLDNILRSAALPGVTVIEDRITEVLPHSDALTLLGSSGRYQARSVIVACGGNHSFAKKVVSLNRYGASVEAIGDIPESIGLRIERQPKGELYVTRVGVDRINIAFLGDKESLKQHIASFHHTVLPRLEKECGAGLTMDSEIIGAGPFPSRYFHQRDIPIILAGDSLEAFDPLGGLGMTHALWTGRQAARAAQRMVGGNSPRLAIGAYLQHRARESALYRGFTRFVSFGLQRVLTLPLMPTKLSASTISWAERALNQETISLSQKMLSTVGSTRY